jgi:hypothetical protein
LDHVAPSRADKAFVELLAEGASNALDVAKIYQIALGGGRKGEREVEFGKGSEKEDGK